MNPPVQAPYPEVGDAGTSAARKNHLAAIDCLRGLAALGVTIFHARVAWWVGWREIQAHPENYSAFDRAVAWLSVPTPFLGSLVMLFFVISGFCVHQPLAGVARELGAKRFFARRVRRIFPPYLAAVLVTFAVGALLGQSTGPAQMAATALMGQNYWHGPFMVAAAGQPATNPALWSIPVELELYLVYPLAWLMARAWGWMGMLTVVGVVTAGAAVAFHLGLAVLDGNFAMYWLIWCGGAWLREKWARGELPSVPGVVTTGALLAGGVAAGLTLRSGGAMAHLGWGAFYFWLLWRVLLARSAWGAGGSGGARALRRLGDWSYSLYLLHFPLLFATAAGWFALGGAKPANFLVCLGMCAAILPAVWLFHRMVERPSHAWARRAGGRA